jgi:catechol 2,3-dioxygenase-like lactoylglutathione lyase family enzyme
VQLHLIEGRSKEGVVEISSRVDHVAFHTDDPDAVQARLEELGIQYLRNVQGPTGVIQIFFHDPDGNHIEVATYPVHPDVDSSAMLR